jgi:hypothetical protein
MATPVLPCPWCFQKYGHWPECPFRRKRDPVVSERRAFSVEEQRVRAEVAEQLSAMVWPNAAPGTPTPSLDTVLEAVRKRLLEVAS